MSKESNWFASETNYVTQNNPFSFKVEFEELELEGLETVQQFSAASGKVLAFTRDPDEYLEYGMASYVFEGQEGYYNLTIFGFGPATDDCILEVLVNGEVADGGPFDAVSSSSANQIVFKALDVLLAPGEILTIQCELEHAEGIRLDQIRFDFTEAAGDSLDDGAQRASEMEMEEDQNIPQQVPDVAPSELTSLNDIASNLLQHPPPPVSSHYIPSGRARYLDKLELVASFSSDFRGLNITHITSDIGRVLEANDGEIYLEPPEGFSGDIQVTYDVLNADGLVVETDLDVIIRIQDEDDEGLALDQGDTFAQDQITFDLSPHIPTDADSELDILVLQKKLVSYEDLPDWLTFDPEQLLLTSTPNSNAAIDIEIALILYDSEQDTTTEVAAFRASPTQVPQLIATKIDLVPGRPQIVELDEASLQTLSGAFISDETLVEGVFELSSPEPGELHVSVTDPRPCQRWLSLLRTIDGVSEDVAIGVNVQLALEPSTSLDTTEPASSPIAAPDIPVTEDLPQHTAETEPATTKQDETNSDTNSVIYQSLSDGPAQSDDERQAVPHAPIETDSRAEPTLDSMKSDDKTTIAQDVPETGELNVQADKMDMIGQPDTSTLQEEEALSDLPSSNAVALDTTDNNSQIEAAPEETPRVSRSITRFTANADDEPAQPETVHHSEVYVPDADNNLKPVSPADFFLKERDVTPPEKATETSSSQASADGLTASRIGNFAPLPKESSDLVLIEQDRNMTKGAPVAIEDLMRQTFAEA